MKIKSLTLRISIVVIITTLAVLMATLLTIYTSALNNHMKEAAQETRYKLDFLVERLNKIQASVEQAANYSIPAINACMNDTIAVKDVLDNIVESNSYVICAALAYAPNHLPGHSYCMPIAVKKGVVGQFFSDRALNGDYIYDDWYIATSLENKPFWTDPYYDLFNNPVISYAVPVNSLDLGFEGVLTLAVELSNLNDILKFRQGESVDSTHQDHSVNIILDRNTSFLAARDKNLVMHETFFTLAESKNDTLHSYIGREIVADREGEVVGDLNGEKSVITWRVLPQLDWTAMVVTPYSEAYASVNTLTYTAIIVALLAIIAAVIILYFAVRRALRPFNQLKSATKLLGEGKYDVQLPYKLVERPDEIGDLGREFVRMENAVKQNIDQLEEERQRLKSSYEMLSTLMHNVVTHLRLPINNLLSYHDVLEVMYNDSDDAKTIQQEAKEAGVTILQQFNQLNELANLISSKAENDDSMMVLSSEDFINDFVKGAQQLEKRYLVKVTEEYHDKRSINIRSNTHILEKLLFELIIEAAKVSKTDTIGLQFMFNPNMTALRIAIVAKTAKPIPEDAKANFFVRFEKEKVNAYATSEFLPLYICYKIAQRLEVNLYVEPGCSMNDPANVFVIDIPKAE